MIGTLTTSLGGTTLISLNDTRLSPVTAIGKVNSRRGNNSHLSCNALLRVTEAEPAVDLTSRRRSSLYDVLRVKRNATPNEIKTAYRNLAKLYHPDALDLEQHDDREFIEIHNAYATLYDPADRAMYDLKLNGGFGRRSGPFTAGGQRQGFYTSRRWETDQCW